MGATFTTPAVRRIVTAVRRVERTVVLGRTTYRRRSRTAAASTAFAFSIASIDNDNLRVTVYGGPVMGFATNVMANDVVVSVGGTQSNPHYVYAYGQASPLSGQIAPISTATFPNHAQGQWRRPLFKVYILDGAVYVPDGGIYHEGLIDLRTWYGP